MLSHHILDTPSLSSDSHQDRSSASPGLEDRRVLVMSNAWLSQGLDTRAGGLSITWYYWADHDITPLTMLLCCLIFLSAVGLGAMTIVGGGQVTTSRGQGFTVLCTLDRFYEFCTFRWARVLYVVDTLWHQMCHFRSPSGQTCDFEWIRKTWNVTTTSCRGLEYRAAFAGGNKYF